jgi:Mg-chelatase subunit ChlD
MVLFSLALHVCLVAALLGFHFRPHGNGAAGEAGPPETLSVIFHQRVAPVADRLAAQRPVPPAHEASLTEDPTAPMAPVSPEEAADAAKAQQDSAHVRWPSKSLLLPSRAPHLNSRDGVVFLLDVSGSMYERYAGTTRLALARQLLAERIRGLKDGTPFAIAMYGETAQHNGPLVPATDVSREAAIRYVDRDYACGGSTNLPAGLDEAEELGMGAIMLVTDGDLNTTKAELLPEVNRILGPPGQAPSLTVVGIGPRPETNAREILQALARQQDGTYFVGEGREDGSLTLSPASP